MDEKTMRGCAQTSTLNNRENLQYNLFSLNYLKLIVSAIPRQELEILILDAASRACRGCRGEFIHFSMNDVYREIRIGNTFVFADRKRTIWDERFEIISKGIVQYTLKTNGYSSLKRSGGVNVCRWYKSENTEEQIMGNGAVLFQEENRQKPNLVNTDTTLEYPPARMECA